MKTLVISNEILAQSECLNAIKFASSRLDNILKEIQETEELEYKIEVEPYNRGFQANIRIKTSLMNASEKLAKIANLFCIFIQPESFFHDDFEDGKGRMCFKTFKGGNSSEYNYFNNISSLEDITDVCNKFIDSIKL